MSDNKYLRLTIDVCVFHDTSAQRVANELLSPSEGTVTEPGGKKRFYPLGTGERLARRFMAQIIAGGIEIDDIRDVEDHSD